VIKKICLNCNSVFSVHPSLIRVKHCSKECYWARKTGSSRPESVKLKISATMKRKGLHGPIRCGSDSNFWCGGRSLLKSLRQQLMMRAEYKNWRKAVFERDNYTCTNCGATGIKLNADHSPFAYSVIVNWFNGIKSVEDLLKIEFLFDVENGQTLCEPCHWQFGNKNWIRSSYAPQNA